MTKPDYRRRGRRSSENCSGLSQAFIPLLNWIISNDIDVINFSSQYILDGMLKWYTGIRLNINSVSVKEVEITTNMMNSLVDLISSQGIDFRKLNVDFLVDAMNSNLRKLMEVPLGTKLKAIVDYQGVLTSGNYYEVHNSMISGGSVRVMVSGDNGQRGYYDYKNFEDVQIQRDLMLKQLGI
jgi:hypothetical protein